MGMLCSKMVFEVGKFERYANCIDNHADVVNGLQHFLPPTGALHLFYLFRSDKLLVVQCSNLNTFLQC